MDVYVQLLLSPFILFLLIIISAAIAVVAYIDHKNQ